MEPSWLLKLIQATDPHLVGNDNAKAKVAAIIDGTGSLGAAIGPLIAGAVSEYVSYGHSVHLHVHCRYMCVHVIQ